MRYTKQAIPVSQQLTMLKQRGLIVNDENEAIRHLGNIGYFRLASYWRLLEADKTNHIFKPGSTFENAMALYEFDSELKVLIFAAIQKLEVALRSKVNQHFATKFGPFWFMDETLFTDTKTHAKNLSTLRDEVNRSYEDFITEHFQKYSDPDMPPSWKTLEVASFGTLSKLYSNFSDADVKKKVAKDFGIPAYKFLRSWLKSFTIIRNNCAHHARLWNQRFPVSPMMPNRVHNKWITEMPQVHNSLYPNLCCIIYWLNAVNPSNSLASDIRDLLKKYPKVDPAAMGFTRGWQTEPLWQ